MDFILGALKLTGRVKSPWNCRICSPMSVLKWYRNCCTTIAKCDLETGHHATTEPLEPSSTALGASLGPCHRTVPCWTAPATSQLHIRTLLLQDAHTRAAVQWGSAPCEGGLRAREDAQGLLGAQAVLHQRVQQPLQHRCQAGGGPHVSRHVDAHAVLRERCGGLAWQAGRQLHSELGSSDLTGWTLVHDHVAKASWTL